MARYQLVAVGVYDTVDGHAIKPPSADWDAYQAWLAAGNLPDPAQAAAPAGPSADELAAHAEIDARQVMRAALRTDTTVQFLRTHTPAETEQWVIDNVTDLASAKLVLRKLAMIVSYLARERLSGG